MKNGEKLIYQDNKTAYELAIGFILLNTLATILTLNFMEINIRIGTFVMFNIILSLVSFLMAMKVKKYSLSWAYGAVIISIIQFLRSFFMPELADQLKNQMTMIIMIASAGLILASGIVTIGKAKTRLNFINQKNE
jgi:hypothetical protein